jgi:GT2 family glycosyltransferase
MLDSWGSIVNLTISPVNLGDGGGRKLLGQGIETSFTMMLDDDMYLTDGAIKKALNVLQSSDHIGAVSIPSENKQGHLMSFGGRNLVIKDGVIFRPLPKWNALEKSIEVQDLDGGAMLMKSAMLSDFQWDSHYFGAFGDLDKSLQILRVGKWKQAIVPAARLVHDRSWLQDRNESSYVRTRLDGLTARRCYHYFRRKWHLRLPLVEHILSELGFPLLTIIPWQWPNAAVDKFLRSNRRVRRESAIQRRERVGPHPILNPSLTT